MQMQVIIISLYKAIYKDKNKSNYLKHIITYLKIYKKLYLMEISRWWCFYWTVYYCICVEQAVSSPTLHYKYKNCVIFHYDIFSHFLHIFTKQPYVIILVSL